MSQKEVTSLAQSAARAILSFTLAVAAGAAANSNYVMIAAFFGVFTFLMLGGAVVRYVAHTSWGMKPVILAFAMANSVAMAAMSVAAFGVLLAGHVALNFVLEDFRIRELDAKIGVVPFAGIIAYYFIASLDEGTGKRHPMRALTRGVAAAALAAVILFMMHAVLRLSGVVS